MLLLIKLLALLDELLRWHLRGGVRARAFKALAVCRGNLVENKTFLLEMVVLMEVA